MHVYPIYREATKDYFVKGSRQDVISKLSTDESKVYTSFIKNDAAFNMLNLTDCDFLMASGQQTAIDKLYPKVYIPELCVEVSGEKKYFPVAWMSIADVSESGITIRLKGGVTINLEMPGGERILLAYDLTGTIGHNTGITHIRFSDAHVLFINGESIATIPAEDIPFDLADFLNDIKVLGYSITVDRRK